MASPESISVLVDDSQTAVLSINNPPANALSVSLLEALGKTVRSLNANEKIRAVVVVGGSQKFFAAGADIKELQSIDRCSKGREYSEKGQVVLNEIENASKPYIAAVEGHCLGGGLELALACHLRIAGSEANFGLPEINLGLMPGFGGSQRLTRLVGVGRALEWMLTGDNVSAEEALRTGLVNRRVGKGNALETALNLGKHIAQKSPHAVAAILKTALSSDSVSWQEKLMRESRAFGSLFETDEAKEGMQAFLEKRIPKR